METKQGCCGLVARIAAVAAVAAAVPAATAAANGYWEPATLHTGSPAGPLYEGRVALANVPRTSFDLSLDGPKLRCGAADVDATVDGGQGTMEWQRPKLGDCRLDGAPYDVSTRGSAPWGLALLQTVTAGAAGFRHGGAPQSPTLYAASAGPAIATLRGISMTLRDRATGGRRCTATVAGTINPYLNPRAGTWVNATAPGADSTLRFDRAPARLVILATPGCPEELLLTASHGRPARTASGPRPIAGTALKVSLGEASLSVG